MNSKIISEFNTLISNLLYEKPPNYSFKINSFKKFIDIVETLDFQINSIEQIKHIKGIGKGTLERIEQILKNGNLEENNKKIDDIQNEFNKLQKITGVGPSKAKQLIEKNIKFEDLINNKNNVLDDLTHHQKLGVKYYYDVLKPIPHETIIKVEEYLKKFKFKFNICGSYRRKKNTSGDIDILIQKEDKSLQEIIDILYKKKFLVDHLTECGSTKYMGFCKIKNSHFMRIDIRLITKESYPFALLYFTGSKKTNTMMRNKAIKLGFKLNEYSLVKVNESNTQIYLDSEELIFDYLKLDYIKPENR
jgi:DNA polymerase/3'-5' exonuclease PolX